MKVTPIAQRSYSSSASTVVFLGRNHRGNWVARELNGLFGGLFVDRAQALKYALFQNGRRPEAIIELQGELELDIPLSIESWRTVHSGSSFYKKR
ncbi:hypothetical protein XI07_04885 [Bradyrhizobium sp. CCBAU 11445]|uniref:hypothetical protein n=1 Tax=Bradyrhizobium sp. CCBAU 11445 TaxID=1630896 RepID=UPI00230661EC|nr:hypothetical protein [Bradyrhizobium sp. CCBAU 11445]MDA9481363.1 hypothetical protein [Bradyrhizobium sp. CCBAU 11445]